MELIVISHPEEIPGEAIIINQLFEAGVKRFHLRKPNWGNKQFEDLLLQIDKAFHSRILLHQHHYLVKGFELGGLHYKENDRLNITQEKLIQQKSEGYMLSTSSHITQILEKLQDYDYTFFGPVFNSLSKPGYESKIPENFILKKTNTPPKVIALGGIDETNLTRVREMNFDGAAVLGAIWNKPYQAIFNFKKLKDLADEQHD